MTTIVVTNMFIINKKKWIKSETGIHFERGTIEFKLQYI